MSKTKMPKKSAQGRKRRWIRVSREFKATHPRIERTATERKEEKVSKEENDKRKVVEARKRTRRTRLQKEESSKVTIQYLA